MGIEDLLFGGSMGWNAGQPRGWRDGTCSLCSNPMACQQSGHCHSQGFSIRYETQLQQMQRNAQAPSAERPSYDVDLPPEAVREVKGVPGISYLGKAPISPKTEGQLVAAVFGITQEGDSDGGECD